MHVKMNEFILNESLHLHVIKCWMSGCEVHVKVGKKVICMSWTDKHGFAIVFKYVVSCVYTTHSIMIFGKNPNLDSSREKLRSLHESLFGVLV